MNDHDTDDGTKPLSTSRRSFCGSLVLTSAGLVAVPGLARVMAAQDSTVSYPPRKIEDAETLLPGSSLYFNYPTRNDPAVLIRSSEGEYRAYSRRCPHAGCSVDFDAARRCLKCPCHQGTFDARLGQVIYGPPQRPLDEIVLQVRAGGYIWAVGKRFTGNTDVIALHLRRSSLRSPLEPSSKPSGAGAIRNPKAIPKDTLTL